MRTITSPGFCRIMRTRTYRPSSPVYRSRKSTVSLADRWRCIGTWRTSGGRRSNPRLEIECSRRRMGSASRSARGRRSWSITIRSRASAVALNGVLERVLSATPWSEFDSAYAFRGGPAAAYLRDRFYNGSDDRLSADLCKATVLDLAATNIDESEQSLPFIGGWKFAGGKSGPLENDRLHHECAAPMPAFGVGVARDEQTDAVDQDRVDDAHGAIGHGRRYGGTASGRRPVACADVPLPKALATPPKVVYDALMGWRPGNLVVPRAQAAAVLRHRRRNRHRRA